MTLLRHGESTWNLENRFTGNVDVPLSAKGEIEARQAGRLLKEIPIDMVFTSTLKRAIDTATIVLEVREGLTLPIERSSAINERHYGILQGLNKADVAKKYGEEQLRLWRRSYDVRPPDGESLEDTAGRSLPYFKERILGEIRKGNNVLVVAHGNSLRSIVMYLDSLSPEQVVTLNIPTGIPLIYDMTQNCNVTSRRFLMQDDHDQLNQSALVS